MFFERELHLPDGRVIADEDRIESMIDRFELSLGYENAKLSLRISNLRPDMFIEQDPPFLGNLKIIKPEPKSRYNPHIIPVTKEADVRLLFDPNLSKEARANLSLEWFEYWFSMDAKMIVPLIVCAQVLTIMGGDNLASVDLELSSDKIDDKKRQELEEKRIQLILQLKKVMIARLEVR
jgi:hypothetical protein